MSGIHVLGVFGRVGRALAQDCSGSDADGFLLRDGFASLLP